MNFWESNAGFNFADRLIHAIENNRDVGDMPRLNNHQREVLKLVFEFAKMHAEDCICESRANKEDYGDDIKGLTQIEELEEVMKVLWEDK